MDNISPQSVKMNNKNVEINKNIDVQNNYLITFCVEEALKNKEIVINISNLKNFSSPSGHPYVPPPPIPNATT